MIRLLRQRAELHLEGVPLRLILVAPDVVPLVHLFQPGQALLNLASLHRRIVTVVGRRLIDRHEVLDNPLRQLERREIGFDLSVDQLHHPRPLLALTRLSLLIAVIARLAVGSGVEVHLAAAVATASDPGEGVPAMRAGDFCGTSAVPPARCLCTLEQLFVDHGVMRAGHPSAVAIWQLPQIEAVGEHPAHRVLREQIASAVPAGAVAGGVQQFSDHAIALAFASGVERQQQPVVVRRAGDDGAVCGLRHAEGEQAVVDALRLALGLALLGLDTQVVAVELAKPDQHREHELAGRRGIVDVLGDRDEPHASGAEPMERLEGKPPITGEAVELVNDNHVEVAGGGIREHSGKLRSLFEVVGTRALAFVAVNLNDLPPLSVTMVLSGPFLSVETVAVDLLV